MIFEPKNLRFIFPITIYIIINPEFISVKIIDWLLFMVTLNKGRCHRIKIHIGCRYRRWEVHRIALVVYLDFATPSGECVIHLNMNDEICS